MKIISLIVIVLYLVLPVTCLTHPCSSLGKIALCDATIDIGGDTSPDCPLDHDDDDCETNCCCAGYNVSSLFPEISLNYIKAKYVPYKPYLALPNIIDRIFVPPQNLS